MSKAGKQKVKKSKEAGAKLEEEARFDTNRTTDLETPSASGAEATGEADKVKKKSDPFRRFRKTFTHSSKSSSKHAVRSPTSPTSVLGDAIRRSGETEEITDREGAVASVVCANLPDSEKAKCLENALDGHIRLHADMMEEMRRKTNEVERGQNEIAELRSEMDTRDKKLRIQGEEIRVLKESLREKEQEIEDKLQSIEDFHTKVEQRDRQLDYLKKPSNEAELCPKALEAYDMYFDVVTKLTEDVTDSEATVKMQQQELMKLRNLLEQAKGMEEQVTQGVSDEFQHKPRSGEMVDCAMYDATRANRDASRWRETLSSQSAELSKLRGEVGALRRENDDLRGEIEAHKAQADLWKEKFQKCHITFHQIESDNRRLQDQIKQLFQAQQHESPAQLEQANNRQLQEQKTRLEQTNQLQRAQLEVVQQQLRKVNQQFNQAVTVREKLEEQKAKLSHLVAEKDGLLQASQAEQLRLRQLTQEKDRFLQSVQNEKDQLRQRVLTLTEQIQKYPQRTHSQHSHQSDFWEVPRNEITLNTQKFLGSGAWGFVVEGIFRGQKVAVKCLHDMIRHPEVMEIIRKEIGIMAQIRHPNLVLLMAAVIDAENDPLIVTELLDTSLRKAYENHRLQDSSKVSIFRDVASALNYLHLHQGGEIIHRDVSSANVLLEAKPNNQWKAKLSDFGSAKLAIEAKTTGPGAPAYTAPEVQNEIGIHQTGKLDVYSYGVLLCEVIMGQFPLYGFLPGMVQVVQSRWPFMHGLVTHCIQDHPDNRPTMSYVLGEFNKLQPNE